MLYVISRTDKPEHGHVRRENRPCISIILRDRLTRAYASGLRPQAAKTAMSAKRNEGSLNA